MAEVSIEKLTKSYDGSVKVLDGVDLRINQGELVFLLGPSGCGKSTLLRILAGLVTADSGTISFDGKNIANSYWKTTSSIPTLHRDRKTGIVSRLGGAQAKPGRDFAAKKSNSITISDILQNERRKSPKAPGYSGLVDLGKGAVPEFDKDEK